MRLDIDEVKITVVDGDDLSELKYLELDLVKEQGNLFKSIAMAETQTEKIDHKSRLSEIVSLIDLCKERQRELKDKDGHLNHNFRTVSRKVVGDKIYNRLLTLARMPLRDAKAILSDNPIDTPLEVLKSLCEAMDYEDNPPLRLLNSGRIKEGREAAVNLIDEYYGN